MEVQCVLFGIGIPPLADNLVHLELLQTVLIRRRFAAPAAVAPTCARFAGITAATALAVGATKTVKKRDLQQCANMQTLQ
jgi:hypothetical protein